MTGIRLHIRPDDCDACGHVNNSVYLAYIQDALAQTLREMGFAQDWMDESLMVQYLFYFVMFHNVEACSCGAAVSR